MYENESSEELAKRADWRITEKHMDGSVVIVASVGGKDVYRFFGFYRPQTSEFRLIPNDYLEPASDCGWLVRVRAVSIWDVKT